jgi:KDO2-lipid IV(A) lauroyltransferase
LEYYAALLLLKSLGWLPRWLALFISKLIAAAVYLLHSRLRRIALRNLELAFSDLGRPERKRILWGVYANLARLLGEFSQSPKLTPQNISEVVIYDGYENYLQALQRGKGILFLTAHFGAWELCPMAHALHGHPLKFLVRPIDNPRIDQLIEDYRTRCGNESIRKRLALKEVVSTLRQNGAVGILIDQNVTAEEGVFVDFFNIPACTTTSLATIALRTEATVLPGLLVWDKKLRKHRLRFETPVVLVKSDDPPADILKYTAHFNQILEEAVRQHPSQWLWVHRRWKTRPSGEKPLY